jgi:hypothetical protein
MSFFDSDLVRTEMAKISELQEDIYKSFFSFPTMSKDDKINHIIKLEELLDVQKVLYMRLSLSDDPEALQMKQQIIDSAVMMGMPKGSDMNILFNDMKKMVDLMKQHLDIPDAT